MFRILFHLTVYIFPNKHSVFGLGRKIPVLSKRTLGNMITVGTR